MVSLFLSNGNAQSYLTAKTIQKLLLKSEIRDPIEPDIKIINTNKIMNNKVHGLMSTYNVELIFCYNRKL